MEIILIPIAAFLLTFVPYNHGEYLKSENSDFCGKFVGFKKVPYARGLDDGKLYRITGRYTYVDKC